MDKKIKKSQLLSSETQQANEHDGIKEVIDNNQSSIKNAKKTSSSVTDKSQTSVSSANDEVTKSPTNPKITQPVDLPQTIFNVKINNQAIFDTIIAERASRRQGTHKVKSRAEVSGGGKKPWRQKGTGRARAGSIRSPIWVGGGRAFGPTPERNYNLKVNKKVRKLALNSALSLKSEQQAILVHDFVLEKPSTKRLLMDLKDLNLNKDWKHFLIINDNEIIFKSALNVKSIKVNKINSLLVEDVINADAIIFAKDAFERLVK